MGSQPKPQSAVGRGQIKEISSLLKKVGKQAEKKAGSYLAGALEGVGMYPEITGVEGAEFIADIGERFDAGTSAIYADAVQNLQNLPKNSLAMLQPVKQQLNKDLRKLRAELGEETFANLGRNLDIMAKQPQQVIGAMEAMQQSGAFNPLKDPETLAYARNLQNEITIPDFNAGTRMARATYV